MQENRQAVEQLSSDFRIILQKEEELKKQLATIMHSKEKKINDQLTVSCGALQRAA